METALKKSLQKLWDLLKEENLKKNLVADAEAPDFWVKHIEDSLSAAPLIEAIGAKKVLDLGTGGGLPGLVLSLACPGVSFTLVDSVQKKLDSVALMAKALGLTGVTTLCGRAEELARDEKYRERYDVALARAVAPLNILLELLAPFVKPGGYIISYKGPNYVVELAEADNAMRELLLESPEVKHYTLSEGVGERALLIFRKPVRVPPQYPRRTGIPEKRPL